MAGRHGTSGTESGDRARSFALSDRLQVCLDRWLLGRTLCLHRIRETDI